MNKLSEKHKEMLREMVDNSCQNCHKTQLELGNKLEIHRMIRGSKGGLYVPNNILVICKSCHKLFHSGEFR